MILLEKWKILTPLQNLPKNVGDLGKLIVAKGYKKVAQCPINRSIWSKWFRAVCVSIETQLRKIADFAADCILCE